MSQRANHLAFVSPSKAVKVQQHILAGRYQLNHNFTSISLFLEAEDFLSYLYIFQTKHMKANIIYTYMLTMPYQLIFNKVKSVAIIERLFYMGSESLQHGSGRQHQQFSCRYRDSHDIETPSYF